MTRAFCNLVLHYSVARLSWKTIKSLRRDRKSHRSFPPSRDRTNDDDDDCNDDGIYDGNDGVSPVEYEILQGWTILAFHHIYVTCGIEYIVRCVVPFYFHIKMVALFATFVVQTRPVGFGGGMSPIVTYWFDYFIVPSVHKVHAFVGGDPRKWAKMQLAMLPFVFVDYFVFPGLLTSEEGMILARERLGKVMMVEAGVENGVGGDDDDDDVAMVIPPSIAFTDVPPPGGRSYDEGIPMISSDDDDSSSPMITDDENRHPSSTMGEDSFAQRRDESVVRDDDTRVNVDDRRETNNAHHHDDDAGRSLAVARGRDDEGGKGRDDAIFGTKTTTATPPRKAGSTRTPPDEGFSLTAPPPLSSRTTMITNGPILTPLVRRRLALTASKLRKFSPDHRPGSGGGGLPSLGNSPPERVGYHDDIGFGDDEYDNNNDVPKNKIAERSIAVRSITGSPVTAGASDAGLTTRRLGGVGGRRRGQRVSLGDHFRELVTGDANVRVRDHLFNLDLPSTPEKRKSRVSLGRGKANTDEKEGVDARHVTTRRSSRISKRKVF
ncbi:hypothetical protein ACHAXA_010687 [Cyclostephanos tholiformis]|uniref:Uncharacterized protein n=1 Tax=Cyclostephanos tholiformis TaxID=382380 RepID=A0ABD3SED3_9STRA